MFDIVSKPLRGILGFTLGLTLLSCQNFESSAELKQYGAHRYTTHYSFIHSALLRVQTLEGLATCSGVILTPEWIATNEHCVRDTFGDFTVYFGSDETHSVSRTSIAVVPHPNPRRDNDPNVAINDIALIKLSAPIPSTHAPAPIIAENASWPEGIPLETGFIDVSANEFVAISAGFGSDELGKTGQFGFSKLQFDLIAPISEVLAAAPLSGRAGMCRGDSGGPFFVEFDNNQYVLAAIGFARPSQGGCGTVTLAIDLRHQIAWIESVIGGSLLKVSGYEAGSQAGYPKPASSIDPVDDQPQVDCSVYATRFSCVSEAGKVCKWIGFSHNGQCVHQSVESDIDFTLE